MGELNRGLVEQSEAKANVAVAERGEHDGLQQFRLAGADDKSAGGSASAGAQDRLPPLSIESAKYGAAVPDMPLPPSDCPSFRMGVFGRELDPVCEPRPPIKDAVPVQEGNADKQQIMDQNQAGAAGEVDAIKQKFLDENQPGAAREYNPVKQQIMEENLPGAAPKFDAERYQSMSDNQPGSLPQQNRVGRSIAGGGASSW